MLPLSIDLTPAHDLPAWDEEDEENARYNVRLDGGPAIYRLDAATLSDPRLIALLRKPAASWAFRTSFASRAKAARMPAPSTARAAGCLRFPFRFPAGMPTAPFLLAGR